jgi:PAS domain S-box-containing protein
LKDKLTDKKRNLWGDELTEQKKDNIERRIVQLRGIIDKLSECVWVVDLNLNVLEINKSALETVFSHRQDIVATNFPALSDLAENEQSIWKELYRRCFSGDSITEEIAIIRKGKHILAVTLNPLYDANTIEGAVVTAQDITAHKKTQERLQKLYSEHKFISELMQDIYKTKDWKILMASILEKISNLMSVTCGYLRVSHTDQSLIPSTYVIKYDKPKKHCRCLEVLSDKLIDRMHHQIFLAYNNKQEIVQELDIEYNYQKAQAMFIFPIRIMNQITGFLGFADCLHTKRWEGDELIFITTVSEIITSYVAQQISQENTSNSYKITMNVMDNLNAIVTVTDVKTFRVLFANKFAKEKFGDIEGRICWTVAKLNSDKPCDNCEIAELLEMDEGDVLYREVQNEVNQCWYHTSNSLINWIDGRKAHLQIAVDITDRIEMETKLRTSASELLETNKTKDKFFSIIAHDLKNPFLSLMGFSEILVHKSRQMSIADIEECASLIHDAARNAHQLLQNLLTWSQSQTGKLRFQPQELNLMMLADNSLESVKLLANQKQIALERDYMQMPVIVADVNMVTTIIRNLLTNAVKFTNEQGTVTLRLKTAEDGVLIEVEDTGIGMAPDELDKLFRVDVSNKSIGNAASRSKGTGLGLILCKEFVLRHGGTISVTSDPGKGSRFSVRLPLKPISIPD